MRTGGNRLRYQILFIERGEHGFVLKDADPEVRVEAVRDVAHSEQSLEERATVLHAYANETEQTLEVHEEKVEAPRATAQNVQRRVVPVA